SGSYGGWPWGVQDSRMRERCQPEYARGSKGFRGRLGPQVTERQAATDAAPAASGGASPPQRPDATLRQPGVGLTTRSPAQGRPRYAEGMTDPRTEVKARRRRAALAALALLALAGCSQGVPTGLG